MCRSAAALGSTSAGSVDHREPRRRRSSSTGTSNGQVTFASIRHGQTRRLQRNFLRIDFQPFIGSPMFTFFAYDPHYRNHEAGEEKPVTDALLENASVPLSLSAAEAYVASTCFKTGPPRQIGIELEFVIARDHDWSAP